LKKLLKVSIRALARRATGDHAAWTMLEDSFNPRPRTEGDVGRALGFVLVFRFNPRPRTEGDDKEFN